MYYWPFALSTTISMTSINQCEFVRVCVCVCVTSINQGKNLRRQHTRWITSGPPVGLRKVPRGAVQSPGRPDPQPAPPSAVYSW